MNKLILALFCLANVVSLAFYWLDKSLARRSSRRISETRLLQVSFLGPIGAVIGIWWLRHKTRKASYLVKCVLVLMLSLTAHVWLGHRLVMSG